MIVFDIETNGLLPELDTLHSLVLYNVHTKELVSCADQDGYVPIEKGLDLLSQSDQLWGHNILGFDLLAIEKVFPSWRSKSVIRDTLNITRLIWPDITEWDMKSKRVPKHLIGKYSLEAWGHRLGEHKANYTGAWHHWNQDMQTYCEQDVRTNAVLVERILREKYSEEALQLENDFQKIITKQENNGVYFDTRKALKLNDEVNKDLKELETKIKGIIPPWKVETPFTPKRDNRTKGYVKGITIVKKTTKDFNPNSRPQIAKYLTEFHNWQPIEYTDKGNPKMNGSVIRGLPFDEAPLLADFLEAKKLQGYLSGGKNAWLKYVRNGKIHGKINTNGAVTGRCTHHSPNLAQVPSMRSFKGPECRELFYAPEGYKMVGADAEQLELRALAHYLYPYDSGRYTRTILEGDVHTSNQEAAGLPTRDHAKTFIYCLVYGGGYRKIGSIVLPLGEADEQTRIGKELKERFIRNIHGYGKLVEESTRAFKRRGFIHGLDGRRLEPRAEHKVLNTLLQSAGAIIMKKANIILWEELRKAKLDSFCKQVLSIHDEYELIVKKQYAEEVGPIMADAIKLAGEYFNFKCELKGSYKIGTSWRDTH